MRHGFLFINKPTSLTSHDVVMRARRALSEKSIGHLGTLDPEASGLMVLAVGSKALKCIEFFMGASKQYEACITLGMTSTTYDSEGVLTATTYPSGWIPPTQEFLIQMLRAKFLGRISQIPPAFSAVHVGGERAYKKAMRGESVDIPSRMVDISECSLLEYNYPLLRLRITCSSGTYIRSLASDLGATLRTGAYLSALRRTQVANWNLSQACDIEQLSFTDVVPLKEILLSLPSRILTDVEWEDISHGRVIEGFIASMNEPLVAWHNDLPVAFLESSQKVAGALKAKKVL